MKIPQVLRKLLPGLEACILGLPEAQSMLGKPEPDAAAADLLEAGVRLAAVKLGAHGCLLADASSTQLVPGFPVEVVDTTGAGDAFTAGLIYGRLHGLSLPALGTLANALGGMAAAVHGAGTSLPGKDQVIRFLSDRLPSSPIDRSRCIAEILRSLS
jgi:ribokinase